jgi:pimeloyl-ACP methyl ester carboxylesterase
MKILALHGHGTSGAILRSQLTPLMQLATDRNYDFVFVDGDYECEKAPALSTFVPGPFLCYTKDYSPAAIRDVHDLIDSVIEEQGPFDGIVGFSQGAAMALSYLMQRRIESPFDSPFKFAVFFSTIAAMSADDSYCSSIVSSLGPSERKALADFPNCSFESFGQDARIFFETLANSTAQARAAGAPEAPKNFFAHATESDIPRPMNPFLLKERITIPTVHVTGKRDLSAFLKASAMMRSLCDESAVKVTTHDGGHDLPKQARDVQAVLSAMDWAAEKGQREMVWRAHI